MAYGNTGQKYSGKYKFLNPRPFHLMMINDKMRINKLKQVATLLKIRQLIVVNFKFTSLISAFLVWSFCF